MTETPSVTIRLTLAQRAHALNLGNERQRSSTRQGLDGKYGGAPDGRAAVLAHIIGALGECAAALYLGFPLPTSVDTFKAPDLPYGLQVRCRTKRNYDLLYRLSDNDNHRFVLATALSTEADTVELRGWLPGSCCRMKMWLHDHGGRGQAYFVPADCLDSMAGLLSRITFMRARGLKDLAYTPVVTAKDINWSIHHRRQEKVFL